MQEGFSGLFQPDDVPAEGGEAGCEMSAVQGIAGDGTGSDSIRMLLIVDGFDVVMMQDDMSFKEGALKNISCFPR